MKQGYVEKIIHENLKDIEQITTEMIVQMMNEFMQRTGTSVEEMELVQTKGSHAICFSFRRIEKKEILTSKQLADRAAEALGEYFTGGDLIINKTMKDNIGLIFDYVLELEGYIKKHYRMEHS